jgi:hypothetical protein
MYRGLTNAGLERSVRAAISLVFVGVLVAGAPLAVAQNAVPAEFHGRWVPGSAKCDSPLRMQVTADRLTLANGSDSQAIGGIEMAGPGYFAPGYRGIMAVAITKFNGHQPVTATFNADEKKGAAQLELAQVAPGKPNPQMQAYNAHIAKLNLIKRFPLDRVVMKKCPG